MHFLPLRLRHAHGIIWQCMGLRHGYVLAADRTSRFRADFYVDSGAWRRAERLVLPPFFLSSSPATQLGQGIRTDSQWCRPGRSPPGTGRSGTRSVRHWLYGRLGLRSHAHDDLRNVGRTAITDTPLHGWLLKHLYTTSRTLLSCEAMDTVPSLVPAPR